MIAAEKGYFCQQFQNQMDFVSAAKLWRFMPSYGNDLAQSYRLYTLVGRSTDLSSMNRLRETKGIANESKLRLASACVGGQKIAGLRCC
jgi:hypothetical protein